ncbi:hypothetical protein IIA16_03325 [bacterium]|nr:hypothetical protein [bacterium]
MRQRLATGQTLGVFYVESPAMRSLLCQLRPTDFMGLTAASSVIRPGVSESGMKDAYIRRRQGLEKPLYPHPVLRRLLGETLGVMVYQEDVMKVARELGGLSWADANELRKASSTKRGRRAFVARAGERFVAGAISNGCTPAVAADLWRQMASFAGYAFCKAHSASYAQESMACLWLAAHEPAAFWAGVLANGGGYYGLSAYLEEARRQGVEPLPCDLNLSAANWQPERARPDGPFTAVRPGLAGVRGLRACTLEAILEGRPFAGVSDLLARTPCRGEEAASLVAAGALDFTGRTRATLAVLAAKAFFRGPGGGGLVGGVPDPEIPRRAEWDPATRLLRERLALGCSPSAPPVSLVLPGVAGRVRIANLASRVDKMVWVVGHFVIARGHRTEGGAAMRFFTVEDETGLLECVAWPQAWRRLHKVLRQGAFWALRGRPRDRHGALTLEVEGAHRLAPPAGGGAAPSAGG